MDARGDDRRRRRIEAALGWLERYGELAGGWEHLRTSLEPTHPVDLRVNRAAIDTEALLARLKARGASVAPVPSVPGHFRATELERPGATPEYVAGYFQLQGASSAVAALALDPRPGETVLDLCSSPGGKTALLSRRMEGRGLIVANEPNRGRLAVLGNQLGRLGCGNVVAVQHDGRSFPGGPPFDRVLVDAPCSGEGTFRIASPKFQPPGEAGLAHTQSLQRGLLRRALELVRPGGHVVYATCAYAPEENEAVVASVVARTGATIEPLPDWTPGVPALEGWRDDRFPVTMVRCRRIFPFHTGSWGFFVAALRRP